MLQIKHLDGESKHTLSLYNSMRYDRINIKKSCMFLSSKRRICSPLFRVFLSHHQQQGYKYSKCQYFFFLIYTYHYILSGEMKHTYSNWQTAFTWNYTHPPKKTCSEKEQEETEKRKKRKCSRTSESEGKDVSAWVSFSIWNRKGDIVQKANTIQRRR